MDLTRKKKPLIAAAMALLLTFGTAVPTVIASAPAIYAAENSDTSTPTTPVVTHDKGSIMLDTANYIMAPGNIYDVGVTVKDAQGNPLSGSQVKNLVSSGKLKVTDSRTGSIATLQQLSNGNFRVTGKNPGTCYIVYDIGGTHASVKIDVQRGVKQHGTAVRNTSYLTQDIGMPKASDAVVGIWKIGSIVKDEKSYTIRNYVINEMKAQGVTSAQLNSAEVVQALNLMTSVFDSVSITFRNDGSVASTASANGQTVSANGTYTMNGNNVVVMIDGQTTTYQYNSSQDIMTITDQGLTMVLTRR